jgi:sigma-B regulation protein RsbU (phosphoserine phosphatase)
VFQTIAAVYQPLLANLWPSAMMLLGIYFPQRLELDRRHPWIKWLILGPILFRAVGSNIALDLLVLNRAAAAA